MFRGMATNNRGAAREIRSAGSYVVTLAEVQAGLLSSQFQDAPKPALRFIFEDTDTGWRVSGFVNIPKIVDSQDGPALMYHERSRFWAVVGALWGRVLPASDAGLLVMDIPGVDHPDELLRLPPFFGEVRPVTGVRLLMDNEEISAPGRPVLITVGVKTRSDGTQVNTIMQYAPVPQRPKKAPF